MTHIGVEQTTVGFLDVIDTMAETIIALQAIEGSHPYEAILVLQDGCHIVIRQSRTTVNGSEMVLRLQGQGKPEPAYQQEGNLDCSHAANLHRNSHTAKEYIAKLSPHYHPNGYFDHPNVAVTIWEGLRNISSPHLYFSLLTLLPEI